MTDIQNLENLKNEVLDGYQNLKDFGGFDKARIFREVELQKTERKVER